jgi:hypothetical protein
LVSECTTSAVESVSEIARSRAAELDGRGIATGAGEVFWVRDRKVYAPPS